VVNVIVPPLARLDERGGRAAGEEIFIKAFKSEPEEIRLPVNAAGSYVGVKPQ
jgi:hypothetical protein